MSEIDSTTKKAAESRHAEKLAALEEQVRSELGAFTSAASLAKWLNVRAGSITDWIKEGLLEGYRMKRGVRIPAASIARFLADRKMT